MNEEVMEEKWRLFLSFERNMLFVSHAFPQPIMFPKKKLN